MNPREVILDIPMLTAIEAALGDLIANSERTGFRVAMVPNAKRAIEWVRAATPTANRPVKPATPAVLELDTDTSDELADVLEQCDRIIDAAEDVPDRCTDFGLSVIEKVVSIKEWAEKHGNVTEKQQQALDNMEEGIERVRN